MEWEKVERDELDIANDWSLCPKCGQETLEVQSDGDGIALRERCSDGCYVHTFEETK
jgi:hypothetical protein